MAHCASTAGELHALRRWWDHLVQIGPDYGYYPNAPKTWLIVKEEALSLDQIVFEGSGVSITKEGKRHLGAAIGTESFKIAFVKKKVTTWVQEVNRLTKNPTSHCIRCVYSWSGCQVELPVSNHSQYRGSLPTLRG